MQGQAEVIPIFEPGEKEPEDITQGWKGCNEDKPIKFLISAPTMRVPQDVCDTPNAYLAFRAIILAGTYMQLLAQCVVTVLHSEAGRLWVMDLVMSVCLSVCLTGCPYV